MNAIIQVAPCGGAPINIISKSRVTIENEAYRDSIIRSHRGFMGTLRQAYERESRRNGATSANIQLRKINERLDAQGIGMPSTIDDDEIVTLADARSKHCNQLKNSQKSIHRKIILASEFVSDHGFDWPVVIAKKDTPERILKKNISALKRVSDLRWWRRNFRKSLGRQTEKVARELGAVRAGTSPYVSDWAFKRFLSRQKSNRDLIESMEMIETNTGEVLDLSTAVDASTSNPSHKRDELMVRMSGWDEIAKAMDLQCLFLTLTTPSKYHALTHKGFRNKKFAGFTPKDGAEYLAKIWARIRSEWARNGIKCFGFRMCEPHADGTPHWHLSLFFSESDIAKAKRIFGAHALAEDGDEKGAADYRWDCVHIDPKKGSATGYMAKYIAKNIDGYQVGHDEEGNVFADQGAARVRAWASTWGIRQFQQIGCASVTVWRELRRRRDPLDQWEAQEAEAIRKAAGDGDWALFVELMGGAFSGRDDQKLKLLKPENPELNIYGEEVSRIIGLVMRGVGRMIRTRFKVWVIQERKATAPLSFKREASPPVLDLYH